MSGDKVERQRVAMATTNKVDLVDTRDDGMGAGEEHKALSAAHKSVDSSRRQSAPTTGDVDGVRGRCYIRVSLGDDVS